MKTQNPTPKRKTVHLTLWVKPIVKAAVERIAGQDGISVSAAGGAFLERALQQNIDMQYGSLLQPAVEAAVSKAINRLINNHSSYLGRMVFDAGQIRWLFINTLYREVIHPGKTLTKEEFYSLLDKSSEETVKNSNSYIPQVAEIIKSMKTQLAAQEGERQT